MNSHDRYNKLKKILSKLPADSWLLDVSTNMPGTALGIAIDRVYDLFLNYRAERLQMLVHDRTG